MRYEEGEGEVPNELEVGVGTALHLGEEGHGLPFQDILLGFTSQEVNRAQTAPKHRPRLG